MLITEGRRRGRDRMVAWFTTTMHSVPITTDVESSNPDQGVVCNIIWWTLSVTCDRTVFFSGYLDFLQQ